MFSNLGKCLSFTVLAGGVASAILSSSAQAAIVKSDFAGLTVGTKTYDVEFWYDDDGRTSYDDVESQLGMFEVTSLPEAEEVRDAIIDQVPLAIIDPILTPIGGRMDGFFRVPFALGSNDTYRFTNAQVLGTGGIGVSGNGSTRQNQLFNSTFVNLIGTTPTPVPTPALLPGLLGMGIATLRKRKLASSSQA